MLELSAGDYALTLAPERGGAVLRFDWRGQPLMRPASGPAILDAARRPLVPFSVCIGGRRPAANGGTVWLGADPLACLDGLPEWSVAASTPSSATLLEGRQAGELPAPYVASQAFALGNVGLTITISVVNLGARAMPARLGLQALLAQGAQAIGRAAPLRSGPFELCWPERQMMLVLEPSSSLALSDLLAAADEAGCAEAVMLEPGAVRSASLRLRAVARH
jgi:aldose 1-epimerase